MSTSDRVKRAPRRAYNAPTRAAAAARTRRAIVEAAKEAFETRGWAGATFASIAAAADVSPKTIEAVFATKAELLAVVLDFAVRGDLDATVIVNRESAQRVEAAPDVDTMLALYARHVTEIGVRSAAIAFVIETAAQTDPRVAELWARLKRDRLSGARWAAQALLAKPDAPADLTLTRAEQVFRVAIDHSTHRTLIKGLGLTLGQTERWLEDYYRRMLLT